MIRRTLPALMRLPRGHRYRRDESSRDLMLRDWQLARPLFRLEIFISSTSPRTSIVRRVA